MNPIELMKNAEKLSVQQLQQAVESGTLPAYIGVPLIQEKVKQQQLLQTAAAGQQGPQATVKDQIMQQAGVTQLPSGLPQEYADGGIVGFAKGGGMPRSLSEQLEELIAEQQAEEFRKQGWTEEAIKNYQSKGRIDSMSRRNLAPTEQPYNPVTSGPTLREKMTRAAMNARQGEGVIEMPPYQERVNVPPSQAARDLVPQGQRGFGAAPDYAGALEGELLSPEAQQVAGALPRPTTTVNGASFEMPSSTPRADQALKRMPGLSGEAYRPFSPELEKWYASQDVGPGFQQKAAPTVTPPTAPTAASGIRGVLQNAMRNAGQTGFLITPEMTEQVYDVGNLIAEKHGFGPNVPKQDRKLPQSPDAIKTSAGAKQYTDDMFAQRQAVARDYVNAAIQKYPGIDPNLVLAIIEQESSYNPKAKAPDSTSAGYMQVTAPTAKDMGYDPSKFSQYDPVTSIETGLKRFKQGLDKAQGDVRTALAMYNSGPNASMETLAKNKYPEEVLKRYERITGQQAPYYMNRPQPFDTSRVPPAELENQGIDALAAQQPQQTAPQPQGSDMSGIEQALAANMYSADETDPAKIAAQYKAMIGDDKGIAALRDKIASMEAKQASAEEKAPWLALMQAGLATMAGTSPYAAVNIGQGMQTGLEAYTKSQADAEKNELQRYKLEAELANAQRELDISVATKGIESADARRKFNKVTELDTKRFMLNQQQEDRRIGLQERTTAVAERRQNKYDMIDEQAQRYIAENMAPTEAYAKATAEFGAQRSGGMSDANRQIINLRGLIQNKVALMGKVPNQYSEEGKATLARLQQEIAEYERQIKSLMQGGGQAPAPSGTTSGWSNFQQVSR